MSKSSISTYVDYNSKDSDLIWEAYILNEGDPPADPKLYQIGSTFELSNGVTYTVASKAFEIEDNGLDPVAVLDSTGTGHNPSWAPIRKPNSKTWAIQATPEGETGPRNVLLSWDPTGLTSRDPAKVAALHNALPREYEGKVADDAEGGAAGGEGMLPGEPEAATGPIGKAATHVSDSLAAGANQYDDPIGQWALGGLDKKTKELAAPPPKQKGILPTTT